MAFPIRKEGKTENWRNTERKSPKEEICMRKFQKEGEGFLLKKEGNPPSGWSYKGAVTLNEADFKVPINKVKSESRPKEVF